MVMFKVKNGNYILSNEMGQHISNMLPNTSIIKHQSISYFFFHLKQFSWLQMHQVEVYNTSMNSKGKRTMKKKHEKNKLSKSQNVWKNPLDLPLYFQTPYLPFLSMLRNLKSYGCINQLKLYKNSLNPKGKKTLSKYFWLQIINYFHTPIIEH